MAIDDTKDRLKTNEVKAGRIVPWDNSITVDDFLVESSTLGDFEQEKIWERLERYGISLFRFGAQSAEDYVVSEIAKFLGKPAEQQNLFKGTIKRIQPSVEGQANSGDTAKDLGLHVDGTQHKVQPPLLVFQYLMDAKLGAQSVFVDASRVFLDLSPEELRWMIGDLSKPNAAIFSKNGMRHEGPVLSLSHSGTVVLRIRFDEVIEVNSRSREQYEFLRDRFNQENYQLSFRPREGDIVVFDNWRVLHARDEVFGNRIRAHNRLWVSVIKPNVLFKYFLGIRGFTTRELAEIEQQNDSNQGFRNAEEAADKSDTDDEAAKAFPRQYPFQVKYVVWLILGLISKHRSTEGGAFFIKIGAQFSFQSKSALLSVQPSQTYINIKLNPTRRDIEEWLKRVRDESGESSKTFRFVYGIRSNALLGRIDQLIRIAKEAKGIKQKFEKLLEIERIKDAEFICNKLGSDAHGVLTRMELRLMSQENLDESIEDRTFLLAGSLASQRMSDLVFEKLKSESVEAHTVSLDNIIEELITEDILLQRSFEPVVSTYGKVLNSALCLLQTCEGPIPLEVIAAGCEVPVDELSGDLKPLVEAGIAAIDDGLWSVKTLPSGVVIPNSERLFPKALTSLLNYIDDYQNDDEAFKQVDNAIALARKCATSDPKVVAPTFMKLDRHLKRRGDKHLILEVAELSISAARRIKPRERSDGEAETRALICGVSWVYQRLPDHLDKARVAYDQARHLAQSMHLDESLAYCAKCLGRYHRLVAEQSVPGRDENLRLSEARLTEALERFSQLSAFGPEDHEVGDCYSLLARTYLVWKKFESAWDALDKAKPILSERKTSKEYLDFLILTGELTAKTDKYLALSYFDEALAIPSRVDFPSTEMRARAFRQRGLLLARMSRNDEALIDLRKASNIWRELNEISSASLAEWDIIKIEQKIPQSTFALLKAYRPSVRVRAVTQHFHRMSRRGSSYVSSRVEADQRYWRQLIKEAEEADALENTEW
jgi:tetratricopeptide (TPR) repeat protein/alpha-ketoglutarate-dependent taurine dioxygenase